MKWAIRILFGLSILVLLILAPGGTARALFLGWLSFLWRVVPETTLDQRTTVLAAILLMLFSLGVHFTGRWWRRHLQATQGASGPWRLRWTAVVVAVVFLAFAAGIAMVGMTHQIGWLASSPEPLAVTTPKRRFLTTTESNLRELGMSFHDYHSNYGTFPRGGTFDADGNMLHSWETHLLPYIGYVATDIDRRLPWNDPKNAEPFSKPVPEFLNPEHRSAPYRDGDGYALSHYAVNIRVLAGNKSTALSAISDGPANTILAGEVNANFKPWGHPVNWRDPAKGLNSSPDGFGGPPRRNGVHFLMADGSVRLLHNRTTTEVLKALSTPKSGDPVDFLSNP